MLDPLESIIAVASPADIAYAWYMKHRRFGFTVPELLIVISVIAILAGIVSVIWSGALINSRNKSRETDTRNWAGTFDTYKGRFAAYPAMPTTDGAANAIYLCLGSFTSTSGKCGKYTSGTSGQFLNASDATAITTGVAKIGALPDNAGPAVAKNFIGPIVWMYQSTNGGTGDITVTAKFIDYYENVCPAGFEDLTASADTGLAKLFNNLTVGNGKACSLNKTLVYNPNS